MCFLLALVFPTFERNNLNAPDSLIKPVYNIRILVRNGMMIVKKIAIGIMSGTSLDGIDVVITEIEGHSKDTKIKILAFDTFGYEEKLLKNITEAINGYLVSPALICSLNFELAYAYGEAVKKACEKNNILLSEVDFIASHGQTIYHIDEPENGYIPSSLQLGDGSVLATITNTTVVSNFRTADISVGGKGAPLVPFADYILFRDNLKNISLHNIGGIANLTVIGKDFSEDDVYAFDSGPGNMMIDYACKKFFQVPYDNEGAIARSGEVIPEMLEELLNNKYFKKEPPKTTGRELFGDNYTEHIVLKYKEFPHKDIIRTLTEFTKETIVSSYIDYVLPQTQIDEIIFSGGGAYNTFLLELIQRALPHINVKKLEDIGMSSSCKEALAFVVLGNETIHHLPSNLKKATGAKKNVILGQISYAQFSL